jgi:hypothetical protein
MSGGMWRFEYINVKKNPTELERMLGFSKGRRAVPVIVENDAGDDRLRRHLRRLGGAPCGRRRHDFDDSSRFPRDLTVL